MNTNSSTISYTCWKSQIKSCQSAGLSRPAKASSGTNSIRWFAVVFIHKITAKATITFFSPERLPAPATWQREQLQQLYDFYGRLFNAAEPLSDEDAHVVDLGVADVSDDGLYLLQLWDFESVLEELGMIVLAKTKETGTDASRVLVKNVLVCTVNHIADVASIVSKTSQTELPQRWRLYFRTRWERFEAARLPTLCGSRPVACCIAGHQLKSMSLIKSSKNPSRLRFASALPRWCWMRLMTVPLFWMFVSWPRIGFALYGGFLVGSRQYSAAPRLWRATSLFSNGRRYTADFSDVLLF